MLSEAEIESKHYQSLKEARDACLWLARNADPDQAAPRGRHYKNLRTALDELEGTCRQFAHHRGDARWLRLGIVYAKAMRKAQKFYGGMNWLAFKELAQLFDLGMRRCDELANAKTGRRGVILPQRPSDWLILPDQHNISRGKLN